MDYKRIHCPCCGIWLKSTMKNCPQCGLSELDQIFLSKDGYQKWVEEELKPWKAAWAKRWKRRPTLSANTPARVFAESDSVWLLTEEGLFYYPAYSPRMDSEEPFWMECGPITDAAVGEKTFCCVTGEEIKLFRCTQGTFCTTYAISTIEVGGKPVQIAAGERFVLILTKAGDLYVLGEFDGIERTTPNLLAKNIQSVAAGRRGTIYLTTTGFLEINGTNADIPRSFRGQQVYANGWKDTFWVKTKEGKLMVFGDGSDIQEPCLLGSRSGVCVYNAQGELEENDCKDSEVYRRFASLYGEEHLDVERRYGPARNPSNDPLDPYIDWLVDYDDFVKLCGPVAWIYTPSEIKLAFQNDETLGGSLSQIGKILRFTGLWGFLERGGRLHIFSEKEKLTLDHIYDVAATGDGKLVISKTDGTVCYGPVKDLFQTKEHRKPFHSDVRAALME